MNQQVTDIVKAIREKTQVALTLGSGLGGFAAHINVETEISYRDLPGFPVSTAPGHDGRFIFGTIGEGDHAVPVVCMKGRIHFYEGYDLSQVVLPARVMHALGADQRELPSGISRHADGSYQQLCAKSAHRTQ